MRNVSRNVVILLFIFLIQVKLVYLGSRIRTLISRSTTLSLSLSLSPLFLSLLPLPLSRSLSFFLYGNLKKKIKKNSLVIFSDKF